MMVQLRSSCRSLDALGILEDTQSESSRCHLVIQQIDPHRIELSKGTRNVHGPYPHAHMCLVGAHATFATTKPRRMDFSGAHDVRRRPQGLRLARHKTPLDHVRLAVRAHDLADRRRIHRRAPDASLA